MKAPASAMSPPSSHAPRISAGVCTCRATTYGLMKIPAPTIPPMTIIVASNSPNRRARPVAAASGDERTCFSVGDIALRDKGSDGGVLYHRSRKQPRCNPRAVGQDLKVLGVKDVFRFEAYERQPPGKPGDSAAPRNSPPDRKIPRTVSNVLKPAGYRNPLRAVCSSVWISNSV